MAPTDFPALGRLIAPVDTATFFRDHWESDVLVVSRKQPGYFDDLLTLAELDRVITTLQLGPPDVTLANAAREVKTTDYTLPGGVVDVVRLYQQFAAGSTVIINQLQRFVPSLGALCRQLERELSTRFQTNVYLTPASAQGLRVHYDSHDVLVLQIHGTKHWVLYDTPLELPFRGQQFGENPVRPGAPTREFDLHPGDTFYLPRGVMHDASSQTGDSLHVTLGVLNTSWTELLLETVARAGLGDASFRRSLPVGHARADFDRTAARATFRALLDRLVAAADFDAALDHFGEELVSTRQGLLQGQLDQVFRLRDATARSRAGVRPSLLYRLRETDDEVVVSSYAGETRLPRHAAGALRYALEHDDYEIAALPGDLDEAGKLVLVRRLVREGLVRLL
jgi:ribosomal protein L16 Arg81 hydroxylase